MPVSDGFRSRREGKQGLRTFCGLPAADWHGRLACPTREPVENPAGMGTTLTAMLFSGGRAALAHRRVSRVSGSEMVNRAG
jgi:hypothetical protein